MKSLEIFPQPIKPTSQEIFDPTLIHTLPTDKKILLDGTANFLDNPRSLSKPLKRFLEDISRIENPYIRGLDIVGLEEEEINFKGVMLIALHTYLPNGIPGGYDHALAKAMSEVCDYPHVFPYHMEINERRLEEVPIHMGRTQDGEEQTHLFRARIQYTPTVLRRFVSKVSPTSHS